MSEQDALAARWGASIVAVLVQSYCADLRDAELTRCLGPCAAGRRLAETAIYMRDAGLINEQQIANRVRAERESDERQVTAWRTEVAS